ncbi:MAG: PHP domain-containing protein, partial [Bdellovibrionales bacterium]|nr:PHP domain-containing protein [Bdellovibrionales bacterium]
MSLTPPPYAELTCRTHYSFLRGASHPHELIQQAAALGLSAIAITDRNGVYGIPKAYRAWKELPEDQRSALKLIIGSEITLKPSLEIPDPGLGSDSLILLARTRRAYGILCRLITEAHAGKEKGMAFLSPEILQRFLHDPDFNLNLREIAWISPPPLELKNPASKDWLRRTEGLLEQNLSVYIPVFQFRDGTDAHRLRIAETLAKRFGERRLVAANDVHTHHESRRPLQEVLTSIRESTPLKEVGFKLFSNGERRLKSSKEMLEFFSHWPGLLTQAHELSRAFQFDLSELRYRYPSEWIPAGYTAQSYLTELTWKGAGDRYGGELRIPEATRKQLTHELALIHQLGFADYFLT